MASAGLLPSLKTFLGALRLRGQEPRRAKPCSRSSKQAARNSGRPSYSVRPWNRECGSFRPRRLPKPKGRKPTAAPHDKPHSSRTPLNAATRLAASGTLVWAGQGAVPPPPSSPGQSRRPRPLCHSAPSPVSVSSPPTRQGQSSEGNEVVFNRPPVSKGELRVKSALSCSWCQGLRNGGLRQGGKGATRGQS